MSNLDEALRWFDQAKSDLESANILSRGAKFESACFYSQQSAEKALKAFLVSKGYRGIITHSIRELLAKSAVKEKAFKEHVSAGLYLDRQYIQPRYPDSFPSGSPFQYYTKGDADLCLKYAELILSTVEKFLKK